VTAKHIEIVLPVFNEQANIGPLVQALDTATAQLKHRFRFSYLFINDGSTDGSRALIEKLCEKRADIRAIHLIHNFGHSAAIRCGLEHADGDAVVLMDADLQDSPDALPQMVAAWDEGATTVVAVRGKRQERHRLLFHLFYFILRRLSPGHPPFGPFCLLDRSVVVRLRTLSESNRYFPNLVKFASASITTVRVDRNARRHGSSGFGWRGHVSLAITAFLSASNFPVRLASLMGALCSFLALSTLSVILGIRLFTDVAVPGWAPIMIVVFFVSGVQLLCLGVIGEYIARIYEEIKQRPAYFVESTETSHQQRVAAFKAAS
jgi:dolichol-phosphate mannosyltransferase